MKEYDKILGDDYVTLKYKATTMGPPREAPTEYKSRAQKDRERKDARRAERVWVDAADHPDKGYWFHDQANHGTWTGYSSYYCRCPDCFKFMSDFNKERKKKADAAA